MAPQPSASSGAATARGSGRDEGGGGRGKKESIVFVPGGPPYTSAQVLQRRAEDLSEYEQGEILEFKQAWCVALADNRFRFFYLVLYATQRNATLYD